VINDFTQGADRIDLSAIDARTNGAGSNGVQHFTFLGEWNNVGNEFNNQAQLKFHYVNVGGVDHTYVEGNVNNNNAADFQIDLVGHIALTSNDFIGLASGLPWPASTSGEAGAARPGMSAGRGASPWAPRPLARPSRGIFLRPPHASGPDVLLRWLASWLRNPTCCSAFC
jgi:hypothetical protein